jgi:glycine/D-amino acid oxidase-like deaminating enzyme/nitrite reductase/ring-hydroxylating ferredoxin subunit
MWTSDEGRTVSYWQDSSQGEVAGANAPPTEADVCVIGGGIAGLTTAYLLAQSGKSVVVLDDGPIAGGETARTTAHLTWALDDRVYRVEDWHGEKNARIAVESHAAAVNQIEKIVQDESIDCDFARVDGYLVDAENPDDDLEKEIDALHRLGFSSVEWVDEVPDIRFMGRALRFPNQGQFHILRYLRGVATAIEKMGGRICSHTRVTEWTGGDRPVVTTDTGSKVSADSIVLATNYPLQSKLFPVLSAYRTYVIALQIPKGEFQRKLVWDTADPYHYIRIQEQPDHDILIVGGEDHRTGQANEGLIRFERLLSWSRKHFSIKLDEPIDRWSGQVLETPDGLGLIGRFSGDEPHVYMITGDSGMGMTHGTLGAMLVADMVRGEANPWSEVYDPTRKTTFPISETVPEIVDSTLPYADWLKGGEVSSVGDIPPGDGAIIRDGLSKTAVYRDDEGVLYKRSAVCKHLGCVVRFNKLERTWDCPCHGSRYDTDGHVINGPANAPLDRLDE